MNKDELDKKLDAFLDSDKQFAGDMEKIDLEKNWQSFLQKSGNAATGKRSSALRNMTNARWMRIAASLAILIVVAITMILTTWSGVPTEVEIATSEKSSEIKLPDGSTVWLNTRSSIQYAEQRGGSRLATLSGEAYFEIQRRENAPFTINVGAMLVNVIGTSFNLKESQDGQVTIQVLSGKVRFNEKDNPSNTMILEKGIMGIYNPGTQEISRMPFNNKNFLAWKTDTLVFNNTPLDSVFHLIEQQYDVTIHVNDSIVFQNSLTTTSAAQELEDILQEIGMLFDLEFGMNGREIMVKHKNE